MTKKESLDARAWVDQYADYLYNYAMKRVRDEDLAKDLVQETFLAGLEKLDSFEGRSNVLTWLTAILRNKIVDQFRKRSSLTHYIEDGAGGGNEAIDFFEDNGFWKKQHQPQPFGMETDEQLNNKEFDNIFKRCLKKLPALWMSVFTMKHLDEEKTEVICQALKVTTSNYWVIIHRAKLNLRECLQKHWLSL